MQLYAECMWPFPRFVLPIICARINLIGRNQILENLVLAGFVCMFLKKYIQQREADVQLSSCSTSTINSKVWTGCVSNKLLELKDADSSRGLVTSHDRAIMEEHISVSMCLNFRVVPPTTNQKFQ